MEVLREIQYDMYYMLPATQQEVKDADLRYINDTTPGFTRERKNDSFIYKDIDGKIISSETVLSRIKDLVIPPAWEHVWICPFPSGYLQATGTDEKGRKQYIYHKEWKKISQENKFDRMIFFGEVLPKIRTKVREDIDQEELSQEKILATVVWLLEHTLIRIGNDEYAKENNSFGLTTLRMRHVKVRGKEVTFEFRGKSGIEHTVSISHPKIAKIIKECIELPGYEIFQYLDGTGEKHTIDSSLVNNYLKAITSDNTSAKEFRTWGGTVLSAETLFAIGPASTETEMKKNISTAIKKVSQHLRNTATVCRTYYVHPVILSTYKNNILVPHFAHAFANFDSSKTQLRRAEYATLSLLQKYS